MHPTHLVALIIWVLLTVHHLLTYWTAMKRYEQGKCPLSIVVHLFIVWFLHVLLPFLILWGIP